MQIQTAHTADVPPATLVAARALLDDVFEGELVDSDWEHCLGGVHALAWDGTVLLGHASVILRRLLHGGRALRAGYVEGVGVRADVRRQGIGAALMTVLEGVIFRAYDLGALGTTDEGVSFYRSRGWQLWRGPASAITPGGIARTPDADGAIYVLPGAAPLDIDAGLVCDWRDGDVW